MYVPLAVTEPLILQNVIEGTGLAQTEIFNTIRKSRGFGGLEVAYWPLVPKFAGSNLAEAVGFLRAKKSSARLPSEGK
jgi:hypothetical protein